MAFPWGPVIAGASQLGAAGLSLLGGRGEDIDPMEDMVRQRYFMKKGLVWNVDAAREAGLHPLVGAGIQPGQYQPSYRIRGRDYGRVSPYLSRMGQEISRALSASTTAEAKELQKVNLEQEKAKLENMKLRNVGLRKNIDEVSEGPNFPPVGSSKIDKTFGLPGQSSGSTKAVTPGVEYQAAKPTVSRTLGVQRGVKPYEETWIRKDGVAVFTPSEQLAELFEDNWEIKARHYGWKMREMWDGARAQWRRSREGGDDSFYKAWRKFWLHHLPDLRGTGFTWVYETWPGHWRKVPMGEAYRRYRENQKKIEKRGKIKRRPDWPEVTY